MPTGDSQTVSEHDKGQVPPDVLSRIRYIEIKTRKAVNNIFSGEYHSAFKGIGIEFDESRPYQPGDDIRAMDWKVTARSGSPFVKVFKEEREQNLMLVFDLSASGSFGSSDMLKQELAAEICATIAFSAIKNNDKVGLIAFTDRVELFVPPKKGRAHVLRLIREILFFKPRGKGTDIRLALDYLIMILKKRAVVFLVSDFLSEGYEKQMKACSNKHDLIAVRISDPWEIDLPDIGYITLEDAESGESIIVNTSDKRFRAGYLAERRRVADELAKLFISAGVDEVVIESDKSYIDPLVRFFRERERRRSVG